MIKTNNPKVSVIVPFYNDEDVLGRCLKSIYDSYYDDFEVITVNDSSSDHSLDVVRKFPCKIIDLKENVGVANARNKGADAATGKYLIFFDSDIVIEKDTLANFVNIMEKNEEKICQCSVSITSLTRGFAPDLIAISWNHYLENMAPYDATSVSTLAFCIDKEVFEKIGQFDTQFESAGGEEFEIGRVLRKRGYKIYTDKGFVVHHHFQHIFTRFKTLYKRSSVYARLVFRSRFELDKVHGTFKEGLNSTLSVAGILSFIMALFYHPLISALLLVMIIQTSIDYSLSVHIIKKRGLLFFLRSIPVNFLWYFAMGLGVINAAFSYVCDLLIAPFKLIRFFFSKDIPYVIFFVTANCNLLCSHCFNWKKIQGKSKDLSLDEISKISKKFGRIKYLTYSGGEPSIRSDIVEITQSFYRNNKVEILNFITNGLKPELIKKQVLAILRSCSSLNLMVCVSLDGIREQHDKIRNLSGAFEKAVTSINELKKIEKIHPKLMVFVITTFSKYNEDNILDVVDYVTKELKVEMGLTYVRGDTYKKEAKNVSLEQYVKAARLVRKGNIRNLKHLGVHRVTRAIHDLSYRYIEKVIRRDKNVIKCYSGSRLIEVGDDGTIFPCEPLDVKFGNICDYEYDIKKVMETKNAKEFIADLKRNKCYCTWECSMKNNIIHNPSSYPTLFWEWFVSWLR